MGQMTLTATCGHAVAYEFEGEPNPNKVARIVGRKCQACRVRAGEEHNRRNRMEAIARRGDAPPSGKVPKGQEPKLLPAGTTITLVRQADGRWAGTIAADGIEATAEATGLMGLGSTLARRWLSARGAKLTGKV